MKVLVAYRSSTGNTKKVAEAIYDEIKQEKEIKSINDVESIENYDLVFLGFPIHNLGPDGKTVKFLKKHCVDNRQVALFITHASPEDHEDLPPMLDKFKQAAAGANIVDMFDCQGELAKAVKFLMSVHPSQKFRAWAKEDDSPGKPDAARLEKARAFARDTMAKLASGKVTTS